MKKFLTILVITLLVIIGVSTHAYAADGIIDPTFNVGGTAFNV